MANQDVETSIQDELDFVRHSLPDACIHRVPECMIKANRECYQPLFVSIGPLYYHDVALKPSHDLKLRHLQCFLDRSNKAYKLGDYINSIRVREGEIRSYYAEVSSLSSIEFIKMVVVDAAFIIIYFMWFADSTRLKDHPMEKKMQVIVQVQRDLFLVENQLPFFVLRDLYAKAFGAVEPYKRYRFSSITCTAILCTFLHGRDFAEATTNRLLKTPTIGNLVDFLRICCSPTNSGNQTSRVNRKEDDIFPNKTVRELKAAGVKFKASESGSLLDITFSKGVLQIPALTIQDITNAILRSIVFYEQCHHYEDSYMIDYLFFMDALIDTPEDVKILTQHGIIEGHLGSDAKVATLFNQITKDVTMKSRAFYYHD